MAERAIAAQAVAGAETVERNGKVLNAGERHADTPLVESGPPTSRGRRPFRFFSSGPPGRDSTRDEGGCANRSSRSLRPRIFELPRHHPGRALAISLAHRDRNRVG